MAGLMNCPPLCIIQARYASVRLPGKMCMMLGDETLAARSWRIACAAFGKANSVVAIPARDEDGPLGEELRRIGATIFAYLGDESDVLGRFRACAWQYRWHPDSIIVRYTADDPFKDLRALHRVACGERLPVEIGGEAFTLGKLEETWQRLSRVADSYLHEHLTNALFATDPPPCPPGAWTIDTLDQLNAARVKLAEMEE